MQTDDLILVSIDDHVVEPPDMFLNHVPDKYKDEAPIVVSVVPPPERIVDAVIAAMQERKLIP